MKGDNVLANVLLAHMLMMYQEYAILPVLLANMLIHEPMIVLLPVMITKLMTLKITSETPKIINV